MRRPLEVLASGMLGTAIPGGAPATLEVPAPWTVGAKELSTVDGM